VKIKNYMLYYGDEEPQYAPKLPKKKKKVRKMKNTYGDENWSKNPPRLR
jgi:hypothetical protein